MRFTVSSEAIERLRLSTELKERVFDGPPLARGILNAFTVAEIRWAKRELLRIGVMQDVDLTELRPLYFFLTLRRADPRAIEPKQFPDLADADFLVVPHEYAGDLSECLECGEQVRSAVHDVPEPGEFA